MPDIDDAARFYGEISKKCPLCLPFQIQAQTSIEHTPLAQYNFQPFALLQGQIGTYNLLKYNKY